MSPLEIFIIVAAVGWAVYQQTRVAELSAGPARFKMAAIYGIVGLVVGGFALPHGWAGAALVVVSFLLSVVVGVIRGRLTRVWVAPDGRVLRQGTRVTVGLFLGLVLAKFGVGTFAYFAHIQDGAGLGEILVMIAIMIAVQAELVHRRAQPLRRATADTVNA